MGFFGKSKSEVGEGEEPRDPAKRRTLRKLVGVAGAAMVTGSPALRPFEGGTFEERIRARDEMRSRGITRELEHGRISATRDLRKALVRAYNPTGVYASDEMPGAAGVLLEILSAANAGVVGTIKNTNAEELVLLERGVEEARGMNWYERAFRQKTLDEFKTSMDIWSLYNGFPQTHGTVGISDYKPTSGKENRYYFKLKDFFTIAPRASLVPEEERIRCLLGLFDNPPSVSGRMRGEHGREDLINRPDRVFVENVTFGVFALSKGVDEQGRHYIAYYDVWDLDRSLGGSIIRPDFSLQFYDRIYYDPITFEPKNPGTRKN